MAQTKTSEGLVTAVADVCCESEDEAMPFDVQKKSVFVFLRQWLKRSRGG